MNDNCIMISLTGFPEEYPILTRTSGSVISGSAALDNIAKAVMFQASEYDISKIKIVGSATFAAPIVDEIRDIGMTEYSINNLEIEVISE